MKKGFWVKLQKRIFLHTKNFLKMTLNKNLKKIIVTKKTNILNIAKMIDQNGFNGVFVCEKNKRLVGIITDSELRKLILKDKFSKKLIAEKIMNKSFFSISQKVNKIDYEKILVNSEKALIPILKNKILVDFVHLSDLKNKINDNDRILIIGGFGYIGSLLTERLLKKGKKITILDKNFYGNFLKSKLKKNKNLRIISGDCFNKKKITKALKNCKHVIHLGEIVGDPAANINSNFSIKNNMKIQILFYQSALKIIFTNLSLLLVVVFMGRQEKFVMKNQSLIQFLYMLNVKLLRKSRFYLTNQKHFVQ